MKIRTTHLLSEIQTAYTVLRHSFFAFDLLNYSILFQETQQNPIVVYTEIENYLRRKFMIFSQKQPVKHFKLWFDGGLDFF